MREGRDNEKKETFNQWFVRAWRIYPLKMLGANCLFLLACLPIFTIPAAYCGLNAVVQKKFRRVYGISVIESFWIEFRESFFGRSIIFWGLLLFPVAVGVLLYDKVDLSLWYSITAVVVVMVLLIISWFFSQVVYLNLKPRQALKNAIIFMMLIENGKINLLLILIWSICITITVFGWPMSGFLLIVLPIIQVVLVTWLVFPTLEKYLANR